MPEHLNRRVTRLEEKVIHLEHLNTPRQQNTAGNSPQETAAQERNSAPTQTMLAQQVPPAALSCANKPKDPWYKTIEGWYHLFAIAGIPFAIGYAVVTYCQWRDLRKNFTLDERAWVGVGDAASPKLKSGDALVYVKAGFPVEYSVIAINSGKTPAKNVHTLMTMRSYPANEPFKPIYERISPSQSAFVMMPGGHILLAETPSDQIMSEGDIKSLTDRATILYFYGTITYDDIFDEHHSTTFCNYLLPNLAYATPCGVYNDAK
jgi:hypothetical protein